VNDTHHHVSTAIILTPHLLLLPLEPFDFASQSWSKKRSFTTFSMSNLRRIRMKSRKATGKHILYLLPFPIAPIQGPRQQVMLCSRPNPRFLSSSSRLLLFLHFRVLGHSWQLSPTVPLPLIGTIPSLVDTAPPIHHTPIGDHS
jgi:hypothetical protein